MKQGKANHSVICWLPLTWDRDQSTKAVKLKCKVSANIGAVLQNKQFFSYKHVEYLHRQRSRRTAGKACISWRKV